MDLESAIDGATVLISGTGWQSDLEHISRKLAYGKGIPSVGVLDHWVNYLPRFERRAEVVLPDQLWV